MGWGDWGNWANTPIGSCGPVQQFNSNSSAKINSAVLYQRSDGTRQVMVDWSVSGCLTYSQQFTLFRCELSTTIKVSWPGGSNEKVIPVYTVYCVQSSVDNIIVSSSAFSYTVEVKVHAECWVWFGIWHNIGREDASTSCVIYP